MHKRTYTGQVKSTKMTSTVVVAVEVPKKHKIYGKAIKMTKRFLVHDTFKVTAGDIVQIEESRPYSKSVSWIIVKKLEGKEK